MVTWDFIDIERNFIRLMEQNSGFSRLNLFLVCLDDVAKDFFESSMGIRCASIKMLEITSLEDLWKVR